VPALESLGHGVVVRRGGEPVESRSKVLGDGIIRRQEALRMSRCLEPRHAPFPLARRLVRIFSPMVQIAVLAVFPTGRDLPLRGTVAAELVCDDHPSVDGRVIHMDPTFAHQFFDVACAQSEPTNHG
jgi:hypothetical protein